MLKWHRSKPGLKSTIGNERTTEKSDKAVELHKQDSLRITTKTLVLAVVLLFVTSQYLQLKADYCFRVICIECG